MQARRRHAAGVVYTVLSAFAWSLTGYFTRLLSLDTVTMLAWRGVFGSLGMLGVVLLLRGGRWRREFHHYGKTELIYIANVILGTILLFASYVHTSVAHVAVIYAAGPIVAALMGWLLIAEIPSRPALLSSVAALAGVCIMVAAGSDGGLLGDLMAIGMTVSSIYSIILIRRHATLPALGCSTVALLLTGIVCMPFAGHVAGSPVPLVQLLVFCILNSAVGVAGFALGSQRLPAVVVALISTLDLPMAVAWVWLAFGEQPQWNTLLGGAMVIGAVVFYILSQVAAGRRRSPGRVPQAIPPGRE
ncbi:DMT family transporter [Achromobacter aloeverae]